MIYLAVEILAVSLWLLALVAWTRLRSGAADGRDADGVAMNPARPVSGWAIAGLIAAIVGWLGTLPLLLLDYSHIAGATAGVGLIGPFLIALLSAALGVTGIICGSVAMAGIRRSERRGAGMAWMGVVLGALLSAAYVGAVGRLGFGWW